MKNTDENVSEARRKRHNANERRRNVAFRDRLKKMREELSLLETYRNRLRTESSAERGSDKKTDYLELVDTIDRLRSEKDFLTSRLQQWDILHTGYHTVISSSMPSSETLPTSSPSSSDDSGTHLSPIQDTSLADMSADSQGDKETLDLASRVFLNVVYPHPMAYDDVMRLLKESYSEIMSFCSQDEFESLGGEVLGWKDKRTLQDQKLQFMLSQTFEDATPLELVEKTFALLTHKEGYRRIQPRVAQLKILQKVNDDCVIVWMCVARNKRQAARTKSRVQSEEQEISQSILLVARGRIEHGYLVTYRSLPLTAAHQEFAKMNGTNYVTVFNWYMFLDAASSTSTSNRPMDSSIASMVEDTKLDMSCMPMDYSEHSRTEGSSIEFEAMLMDELTELFTASPEHNHRSEDSTAKYAAYEDHASDDASDSPSDAKTSGCEVIFGGKATNASSEYLKYLLMEVMAGIVRWQTAVGHSRLKLA